VRLFRSADAGRPRVLDEVAGRVHFEYGSAAEFGNPEKAAVLVHWAESPMLTRSFTTYAGQLAEAGYRLVVVSGCESEQPLEWRGRRPDGTIVIRKPNLGYDFGSWAVALHELPAIAQAQRTILTNDSLVGPFSSIQPILDRFEASPVDVYGLTDTRQYFRHLQSYFLAFNGGVLADEPLAAFYADVRIEPTKWDIIRRYELGLNLLLRRESYAFSTAFRADEFVTPGDNPVIIAWWKLLERGYPFVKREIIRDPSVAPRAEWVAREVEAVFGQHVEDWI
jgi:lipopolysaccharide biosynthesis protein